MTTPNKVLLVCTGRLTGNAPTLAQEYNDRARARGEPTLGVWQRDILVSKLGDGSGSVLAGSVDSQLLSFLGALDEPEMTIDKVEEFSRRWTTWEQSRLSGLGVIEASICCDRLKAANRTDLACQIAFGLVRAGLTSPSKFGARAEIRSAGRRLFRRYAEAVWERCDDSLVQPNALIGQVGFGAFLTYPISCVRLAEILSLLVLESQTTDPEQADGIMDWLVGFVQSQPGVTHMISDRYSVSLIPIALALHSRDPLTLSRLLRQTAVWVLERYAPGELGLAGSNATIGEEVDRILGATLDSVVLRRRPFSQAAAVLLDLCALLGLGDLYEDIYNDVLAVNLSPELLLTRPPDEYQRSSNLNRWNHSVDYRERLVSGQAAAPHLRDLDVLSANLRLEDAWDLLAVSALLRDRYFPAAIARIRA